MVELERKTVSLQQLLEGKTPEAIRVKEEIAHAQRRKMTSQKSLEKVTARQQKAALHLSALQDELAHVSASVMQLEAAFASAEEQGDPRTHATTPIACLPMLHWRLTPTSTDADGLPCRQHPPFPRAAS